MPKDTNLGYGRSDVGSMRKAMDAGKKLFEEEYPLSSGAHILRILPPRKDGPFFFEFMLHYLPGAKIICPSTFNKSCPICSLGNELFKSEEPKEVAQGKTLYHRKAYLCNVVDCRQPKGVNVIRMGVKLVKNLIEQFGDENDPEDEGCNFTDPTTLGANMRINVEMNQGDFPIYSAKIAKRNVPVPYKNWLREMHDLPKLVESKLLSTKELAAMIADVSFEDEDKPRGKKPTAKVEEEVDSEELDSKETEPEEEEEAEPEEEEAEAGEEEEEETTVDSEEIDSEEVDSEEVDSEEIDSEEQPEEEEEPRATASKKKTPPPPPTPIKKKKRVA